jgi:adiponectin receptor
MSFSQFFTPKKMNNRLIPDYDYYVESDTIQVIDNNEKLYNYNKLPSWYKDNPFILNYYRKTNQSIKYYIYSIFKIHNETFNIWTHILASFLFLSFLIFNVSYPPYRTKIDKYITQAIVFYSNIISSFLCFTFSYIMHIFYPINETICFKLMILDYMGIFINITGTLSTFIYFSFYCNQIYQQLYFILLSSITLLILVIFICYKFFILPHQKKWRIFYFTLYGICILIPVIHRFSIKDDNDNYFLDELRYFMLSAISFIIAIALYISQVPERFYPGKFDIIGSSHTLFHIFTLTGDILCTYGLWIVMNKESDGMIC